MSLIKAALCYEFGKPLRIEDVNLRPPAEFEVEVTLSACAICHSDISYAEGAWGGTLPAVYGHEAAGRVSAVGGGVQSFEIGQSVIATLIRSCGTCTPCASGSPCYCQSPGEAAPISGTNNGPIEQGMKIGAFAEKIIVDQSQIAKIPSSMPMDAACLLSCGVTTGVGAVVNSARVRAGEVVVVIGAGGVGLNAIQGARIAGASRIIAVDMTEEKLAVAREFGATDGVLASESAPWKVARKAAGRNADAVLVTVGSIAAYDSAPRYLAAQGRLVMVGMPDTGLQSAYEPVIVAALGQQLIGTKMGDVVLSRDIPWMVDLYQQGRLKLEELVSGRWRLDQINEAIADTKSGAARRNVIMFDT